MGGLSSPDQLQEMLADYRRSLAQRRAELIEVRESLGDRPEVAYPAMVADWGLAYYDSEDEIVARLVEQLAATGSG
jgi:hypothetical protein